MGKTRGKIYPDTRSSSRLLKRMRQCATTSNGERHGRQIPTVLSITCLLSTAWGMRTGFANGKVGIICSINSVRRMSIGCTGDTVIAKIWCTGTICPRRCIQIPNSTVLADSASWKMNGLSLSTTAKCPEIALLLPAIRSSLTGRNIRIIQSFRTSRRTNTSSLITSSIRASGKRRTGIIRSQGHRRTVGFVNGADRLHTSFIQRI